MTTRPGMKKGKAMNDKEVLETEVPIPEFCNALKGIVEASKHAEIDAKVEKYTKGILRAPQVHADKPHGARPGRSPCTAHRARPPARRCTRCSSSSSDTRI
jgi:hypothetical protein